MEIGGVGTIIANHGSPPTVYNFEVDENHFLHSRAAADSHDQCACTHKTRLRVAEIVGLAAVIVIVWGLLLLPVIFYHLPSVSFNTCHACAALLIIVHAAHA